MKPMTYSAPAPKVAIVYDWLDTRLGGAEQVLAALFQLYPHATLFTAYATDQAPAWIAKNKIPLRTTFLQKHPRLCRHKAFLTALLPFAFETFDFTGFDLIISVSSFAAKGIITKPGQIHLCYLLTPTRFLFSHADAYLNRKSFQLPIIKQIVAAQKKSLIRWDRVAAFRPDFILPISALVSQRTTEFYHRATLAPLYPPVDTSSLRAVARENLLQHHRPKNLPFEDGKYDLIVARQVAYKRVDLAIQAAAKFHRPLVVVGTGPESTAYAELVQKLDPEHKYIYLAGAVSQPDLVYYYEHALTFLMPGLEDFGITGLEAQSFGLPVLVNAKSGVAELITHEVDGFHLEKENLASLEKGFAWYEAHKWDLRKSRVRIAKNALEYDSTQFRQRFASLVERLWQTQKDKI